MAQQAALDAMEPRCERACRARAPQRRRCGSHANSAALSRCADACIHNYVGCVCDHVLLAASVVLLRCSARASDDCSGRAACSVAGEMYRIFRFVRDAHSMNLLRARTRCTLPGRILGAMARGVTRELRGCLATRNAARVLLLLLLACSSAHGHRHYVLSVDARFTDNNAHSLVLHTPVGPPPP